MLNVKCKRCLDVVRGFAKLVAGAGVVLLVVFACPLRADGAWTVVQPHLAAPGFALADLEGDLEGHTMRLGDWRRRVVMIHFWASWCEPCREQMPSLQRAYEAIKGDGIGLLAVDVVEKPSVVSTFLRQLDIQLEFPILLDLDASVVDAWPVKALPTTLLVDKQGRIAYTIVGGRDWDIPEVLETIRAPNR